MRLLLINPNTSAHITERLAASARTAMQPHDRLTAVTAVDGPAAVTSAAELVVAQASALRLAEQHAGDHDAIVLGISLDGAAPLLRARHPTVPVVGMTEAALLSACLRVERIGVLTLGPALLPLYRQRVAQIGVAARVVGYRAPQAAAAFSAGGARVAPALLDLLAESCEQLRDETQAQAIVLAGAVLCGYAEALAERCGVTVLDGVTCAVAQARAWVEPGGTPGAQRP